jgi:coniferyl-aldehyde dehydrogenase
MSTQDVASGALRMGEILLSQRAAFLREGPPSLPRRRADLKALKSAILSRQVAIDRALHEDFGHRSSYETSVMEVLMLAQAISYQSRRLRGWMRPQRRRVPLTFQLGRAWVAYQPLGVIGIIAPWNYPLSLALVPLATALAAGNRAMIKPSELTPATSALLATMLSETFPRDQVAVVAGDVAVGQQFAALPFDHILFTGSSQVGRAVMRAASENLVPVTLELGGKSPAIIERGHSIEQAAASIAYGKLANAGQTCIAPDYAMVPEEAVDAFLRSYDEAVRRLYPQGPASDSYTSILNERHHARLGALIEDARGKGAQVIEVGARPADAHGRRHTLAPTIITAVRPEMRIMQEEIFGPVLPVVSYRDVDEVIAYINARPRPLALYYFGGAGPVRRKVLDRTTSGNVSINSTLMHYAQEDLPFGGVGQSGIGAYHGVEGFRSLSHAKGVFQQGPWSLSSLLRPPVGRLARMILKSMLRSSTPR